MILGLRSQLAVYLVIRVVQLRWYEHVVYNVVRCGMYTGVEYIEALMTDQGAIVSYHCKLCDCSFTDPAARLQHLNGRRHLLMYKVCLSTPRLTISHFMAC